jgi:hypothetical protein
MADDDQDRIRANYGGNYDRLVEVKRTYDPAGSAGRVRGVLHGLDLDLLHLQHRLHRGL